MSDIIILTEGYIPPDRDYLKIMEGGPGSGNKGHKGRPGQRGGSGPGGSPPVYEDRTEQDYIDSQVDKELSGGSPIKPATPEELDAHDPNRIDYTDVDYDSFSNIVSPYIQDHAMVDGRVDVDKASEALWYFAKKTNIPSDMEFPEIWSEWLDQAIGELEGEEEN